MYLKMETIIFTYWAAVNMVSGLGMAMSKVKGKIWKVGYIYELLSFYSNNLEISFIFIYLLSFNHRKLLYILTVILRFSFLFLGAKPLSVKEKTKKLQTTFFIFIKKAYFFFLGSLKSIYTLVLCHNSFILSICASVSVFYFKF